MKLLRPQLKSKIQLPGDKSLSHRALIMGSMSTGVSTFQYLSNSEDVLSTRRCLEQLGVKIESQNGVVKVHGVGPQGFRKPNGVLNCGNSGTTMRLLMGLLAAQQFESTLVGDESLTKRPMLRVADPLRQMGAKIQLAEDNFAPIVLEPSALYDLDYSLPIASAQVKSALVLAAWASGVTLNLSGQINSRDHTERMLPYFSDGAVHWEIPCDISAASQWLAMGILAKKSIRFENVLLNPQRMGFIKLLEKYGIDIKYSITNQHIEPTGFVELKSFQLNPFKITGDMVPSLIDEIPLLVLLASQAQGISTITGASELKYKETDRIKKTGELLYKLNIKVETTQDGFVINGPQKIKGASVDSFGDHRLAMLGAVASFACDNEVEINNSDVVRISDPYFMENLI